MSKLNSAADLKSLAAWLPILVKSLSGKKLPVKSDSKAVYVAAGTGSQYAIMPDSETSGKYELQTKEGGKVVVKESGEYKSIDELVSLVTQNTNASLQPKKVLCAGRNLQDAINENKAPDVEDVHMQKPSKSFNSSRNVDSPIARETTDVSSVQKTARRRLNSSRQFESPIALRASGGMTPDLMSVIQDSCEECQPVQAILYNSICPVTGNVCLNVGFYDDEEGVWVLARLNEANVETYRTIDEVQAAMVPPVEEGIDEDFFLEDIGEEGFADDF